jgi:PAS domain S-box-containing protein
MSANTAIRPFSAPIPSARRLQLLVDAVTDYAIYMLDPDGFISSWNSGAQRIKGYTADEVLGRHFSLFFTAEDTAEDFPGKALRTARETGRFESEGWRVRKDGSRFWAVALLESIRDETGELIGFAKITRDITERRAEREALRESERRFRLLVQSVIDYAIFMLDREGYVSNWNTGAQRLKGYRADEIVGQHFSRF